MNVSLGDVQNAKIPGSLSWTKVDTANPSTLLGGSEWTLTGPDGTSATVVDNGQNDTDPAEGKFNVSGLAWGQYTLTETKAPAGYLLASNPIPVTIDAAHTNVVVPSVTNTKAEPGIHIQKTADPSSGSMVNPGQQITYSVTVQNTGNVDLTPAMLDDDLSDVLDNATYVDGSAAATIGGSPAAAPSVDVQGAKLHWQDTLKAGATATVTYKVTVNANVTANDKLVNFVTGSGDVPPGVVPPVPNCVPGQNQNPDCTTTHTPSVPGMHVKKSSDPASGSQVTPGQVITYSLVVQNTGNVDLTPAKLNDDLSNVLDNATYVAGSATAMINGSSAATPAVAGNALTWADELKVGQTATITYKVTVNQNVSANDKLVNVVTGSADVPPGFPPVTPNCVPATAIQNPDCTTTHFPPAPPTPTPPASTPPATTPPAATPPVQNPPSSTPPLANTGAAVSGIAIVAGLLTVVGAIAVLLTRKRKHS